MAPRTIAHIINPVGVPTSSDLHFAQPITFETMRVAQAEAADTLEVSLYTAQYPEDREIVPDGFTATPDLDRSVLDVSETLHGTSPSRRLPLLADILDRLDRISDAEYFIHTNVDIAVQPTFYRAVDRFIASGLDAFVINRRTIPDRYRSVDEIPHMLRERGEPHRGWDCFVFRKEAFRRYRLGAICVGINWVGTALLWNLVCHASRFAELKDEHLTFHIGNDKSWKNERWLPYAIHNRDEALRILRALRERFDLGDDSGPLRPYLGGIEDEGSALRLLRRNRSSALGRRLRTLLSDWRP